MNIHNPPLAATYEIFSDSLRILWSPPQGSSEPPDLYRVYVDSLLTVETAGLDCFVPDPINGHTYHVQITAHYPDGVESAPAVLEFLFTGNGEALQVPLALQNWPNPFQFSTTLRFSVKSASSSSLAIFNVKGQCIRSWGRFAPGEHSLVWDGRDEQGRRVGSGIYLCRLQSAVGTQVHKLMLK